MGRLNKVLLIDDDPIVRFLAKDLIEEKGLAREVVEVSNGSEGLDYLIKNCMDQQNCPDLILLDIRMPDIDGFQFLNLKRELFQIKELPSKVIMVSSSDREDEILKAKELGAIDYIVKPLTEEKVLKVLAKFF